MTKARSLFSLLTAACASAVICTTAIAQERLPLDNSDENYGAYHPSPAYRESESHPLRILAYIVHPIGWLAREVIFRPFSFFASSTPETRAVLGYRDPYDFRKPDCFSGDDSIPDCRTIKPFDFAASAKKGEDLSKKVVYFPDVNFDFDKRALNQAGKEKAKMVHKLMVEGEYVRVELQGHADERGGDEYNMKLGLDRAAAVKAELVSLGVPADHLTTISFGEKKPLFTEKEEWAYAANRRVEVHIADEKK